MIRELWATVPLALTLFWLPLPFASVTSGFRAVAVGAVLLSALALVATARPDALREASRWPFRLLLLIGGLALVQSVAVPRSVLALIAPGRLAWAEGSVGGLSLALSPAVARSTGWFFCALALAFAAGALVAPNRAGRRLVVFAVILAALFQAGYAGLRLGGADNLIWRQEVAEAFGRMRGTFVNPNHFALYLVISLPLVLAAFLTLRDELEGAGVALRLALLGGVAVVALMIFTSLLLSRSRGGVVAGLIAVATAAAWANLGGGSVDRRRWRFALLGAGLAAFAAAAVWVVGDASWVRWTESGEILTLSSRGQAMMSCLPLWRASPWLGIGFGSFRDGFIGIKGELQIGDWWHAHSDWLELLASGGVVSCALVALALGLLFARLLRLRRLGGRTERGHLGAAVAGVVAGVAAHEAVDFGLTMPATAITLAVLCGIGWGLSGTGSPTHRARRGRAADGTEVEAGDLERRSGANHHLESV